MDVGTAVAELLAEAGVRRMYTVPGESFLELLDAAEQHPRLRVVSTRHESGAAFMAEADAKMTGVPAVAAATRGVGASNLAIGVHTARQDSTPMVVLLGQVETSYLGREAFQEVDLDAFLSPIAKWTTTVTEADRLPELLARGLRIATQGRPGPVVLACPSDILAGEVSDHGLAEATATARMRTGAPMPTPERARELVDRLSTAKRPVVIAGAGGRAARRELIALAERLGLGVYASFRRQDAFPNDHPQYLGHLGLGTPPATLDALRDADLVLVVGARLSEVTTQSYTLPRPGADVLQIDLDPETVGATVPVSLGLVADAREALAALLDAAERPVERDWTAARQAYVDAARPARRNPASGLDPAGVIAAMRDVVGESTVVANDAGNFSAFLHQYWPYRAERSQIAPTSGAMGYGLPAGIGARLAAPDRDVLVVSGDGGFLMTGHELETAVRCKADLTVLVMRNALYGTIAMHQQAKLGRTAGIDIGDVDIAGFAESLGATGVTVGDEDELRAALSKAVGASGVTVIDVPTDPDLISPSKRLSGL